MNVLTIAAIVKRKRINLCRDACREMIARGYNVQWRIIGNGPDKKTLQIGAPKQIEWIDHAQDLRPHYEWADVFVLPSLDEGLGMVYAESVLNGTPFVCMAGQGGDEVVNISKLSGLSIRDSWQWPVVINRIIDAIDYASCIRLSNEQISAVREEFNPTKIISGWRKLGVNIERIPF